uniref:Reverse transcriptase domain-containing protein n=1 Tax=Cyclopterus lumpus TaxID=8103 RepID=A0A8C2X602_CYCLU
MDNIFLMRDLLDLCKVYNVDVGVVSLDQEKAFDRVDHVFLFSTLRAFGFGEGFVSLLGLMYKEVSCLVKVGGALSCPAQVQRGIRQGCPISGQLYSIAIEPLLHRLRSRLSGLMLPGLPQRPSLVVSAYADDVNVFVKDQRDVDVLGSTLALYERASSAKVNWGKSEALQVGQWLNKETPKLQGSIRWGRQDLKVLGVFLGTEEFQRQNWEGAMERVCTRLSKWKWLLPQLSYRGRVLIVNNLVASTLWHRLVVLPPPQGLIERIHRAVVDFFWSGLHWLRSAVLYLPVQEGGQGLVDIASRITAFRLQTAQRLLYSFGLPWTDTACVLLRKAGRLGYDKHLFLLQPQSVDLTGLTPFYQSVLQAWQVFTVHRRAVTTPGMWLFEEPLFGSSYVSSQVLTSASLRSRLIE